ncbi:hypothetical protein [Lewinella sp. W8]|uniref:hypothetical protein n=1 Tax=Lewinella sp. W8 TaxID=2528208 RepID=UPI0010676D51|nr:hypothetical protein [Lewinella sp. W8]MTB52814.1 hypothetical protein [Lewinella sp. W8]
MRTFFLLLFVAMGFSAQAQIDDSLPPWFKADLLLDRLDDRLTDLRSGQMSSIENALNQLLRSAPRNPTKQQKMQAKKRIRRAITQYLDPKQIEQLKAMRRTGDKDALDRIIDKSSPNR